MLPQPLHLQLLMPLHEPCGTIHGQAADENLDPPSAPGAPQCAPPGQLHVCRHMPLRLARRPPSSVLRLLAVKGALRAQVLRLLLRPLLLLPWQCCSVQVRAPITAPLALVRAPVLRSAVMLCTVCRLRRLRLWLRGRNTAPLLLCLAWRTGGRCGAPWWQDSTR